MTPLEKAWLARAEKAEAWAAEIHQSMEDQHERNADYQEKLEARAEKAEAALHSLQTIAEELDRIDCALGPKGESMFAHMADRIREAYAEILAARAALNAAD